MGIVIPRIHTKVKLMGNRITCNLQDNGKSERVSRRFEKGRKRRVLRQKVFRAEKKTFVYLGAFSLIRLPFCENSRQIYMLKD